MQGNALDIMTDIDLEQRVIDNMMLALAARNGLWSAAQPLDTPSRREEAEALLRQALARDAEYAQAHALLGTIEVFRAGRGWSSLEEGYVRAEASARRALELNPAEARAHVVLGQIAERRDWDWAAAERQEGGRGRVG